MAAVPVVLDSNVLVSGLRSRLGTSYRLLMLLGGDRLRPVVTVPLVLEYERALLDPAHGVPLSPGDIGKFLDFLVSVADRRRVHFLWRPGLRDPHDDMVLEAAVNGASRHIITFNKRDFVGGERHGVRVVNPGEFLRLIGVTP